MYVNTKGTSKSNAVEHWFVLLAHCQKFLGSNPPSDLFFYVGFACSHGVCMGTPASSHPKTCSVFGLWGCFDWRL